MGAILKGLGENNAKGAKTLKHVGSIVSHIIFNEKRIFGCDLTILLSKQRTRLLIHHK